MYQDQDVLDLVKDLRDALADVTERITPQTRRREVRALDLYSAKDAALAFRLRNVLEAGNEWLARNDVPEWQPGDMIQVQFSKSRPKKYTYVRAENDWPGIRRNLTDDEVNAMYRRGQVTRGRFVAE